MADCRTPEIPFASGVEQNMQRMLAPIKETLDIWAGRIGDPLCRVVTIEDLLDEAVTVNITSVGGVGTLGTTVKVSSNDTTAGYLEDKLVVSHGTNTTNPLELSTLNDGADEDLQLQFDEVKVDHDQLLNFLAAEHIDWSVTGAEDVHIDRIAANSITYAKIQNVSVTDRILGRETAGSGDVEEIACTAAGRAILDDADAAAQRATLDVDQSGTDNSTNVTLAGTPNYITIVGQVITRAPIDLTTDVTGLLPDANIDAAIARDSELHAESHAIASHSDTTATGAELETLTDNSIADALHRHSELVASDGSPDPVLSCDAYGGINTRGSIEVGKLLTGNRNAYIDFVGDDTYADYGLRIIRGNTGANASSIIQHRGTGSLSIGATEAAPMGFVTAGITRIAIASDGLVSLTTGTGANEFSTDGTLAGDSDDAVPTEKATKTYVDARANTSLVDNSIADTLHRHSELVASDGSPDPALTVDANGFIDTRSEIHVSGILTGDRFAIVRLIGDDTYSDYGARFIRYNTGLNAISAIEHRGTGDLQINAQHVAPIIFLTNNTTRVTIASNGLVSFGAQGGVTAYAGGGQTNAVEITANIVEISICATSGDSVKLPVATVGLQVKIINHGVASCDVFPNTGDKINEGTANAAKALAVNASMLCSCWGVDDWECVTMAR